MRIYFDLESTNLLNNSSIDYTQLPYRLKDGYKVHCLVAKNVDTGQVWKFRPHNIEKVKQLFSKTTEVIGHNIINFDMRVLQLVFGIDFEIDLEGEQDKVMGRPCTITDTLVISRLLNPDRFGGHSLDSWGKRTGLLKGDYGKQQNAWDVFTPEMLDYCVQDVEVTEATYKALMEEWGDWDWSDAYKTEKITAYLVGVSEHYGYKFDKVLANKALTDFNALMEQIEQDVEPKLPSKKMGKTAQERFIPPKNQLKKNGEPSANMVKFAERLGGVITEDGLEYLFEYKGRSWNLPMPQEPVEDTEPMRLANQSDMKEWLVTEGWVPTTWSEVDLTIDNKKQKVSPDKFKEKVYRYCKESNESPFGRYRCKHLGVGSVRQMYVKMMQHNLKRPLKVITSPKFTVNADKDLCPNLEAMGSAMGFVSDVARWLTLRHRRNAILSTTGKTGFLVNVKDDGRIPTPANSCGCSTSRFTHSVVCNIPRVTSLYGDIMRSLFGVDTDDRQQIGYDFSGLEARVEGHFTIPFKNGREYAKALLAEKPHDVHCYSEDTEILTRDGWKLFSDVTTETEVAQYEKDSKKISFTKPSEVVWQDYEGSMVAVETNSINLMVTPNHRMLVELNKSGEQSCKLASDLLGKSNSNLRVPIAGVLDECKVSIKYPELVIATQADGYLNKDSSAITFTFTKDRKIARLKNLLDGYSIPYTTSKLMRKDRYETSIRVLAGEAALEIRKHLSNSKELRGHLIYCSQDQRKVMLEEVGYWDGTLRKGRNGGVVLDTTCGKTVEVLELMAVMSNVKTFKSFYEKKISGFRKKPCTMYRLVISSMRPAASLRSVKKVDYYKGKVGCVAVPSTYVVVRRNGKVSISGNTVNSIKMGVTRDEAKTMKYAISYGAQPNKLSAQMNWTIDYARDVFEAFWEAASPLKDLKTKLTREWKANDKKFIKGIDGRKLFVRSEHSIVNMLFQSTGVICAKKANIFHNIELEKLGLRFDPFVDKTSKGKAMMMIHYHDEAQFDTCKSLIDVYEFDCEDDCKKFSVEGKLLSDPYKLGNKWVRHYSRVGELASQSASKAAKYYNLNVDLAADYIVGDNWKVCH